MEASIFFKSTVLNVVSPTFTFHYIILEILVWKAMWYWSIGIILTENQLKQPLEKTCDSSKASYQIPFCVLHWKIIKSVSELSSQSGSVPFIRPSLGVYLPLID